MNWETVIRMHAVSIADHWSGLILATYPSDAARLMSTQTDPFANPVGGTVRRATRIILNKGMDPDEPEVLDALHDIIRIRAVQEFSPSQAVGVVFLLKRSIREAFGNGASPLGPADLTDLDSKVDAMALRAFDFYAEDRERIAQIRVRESHRMVRRLLQRAGIVLEEPDDVIPPSNPEAKP